MKRVKFSIREIESGSPRYGSMQKSPNGAYRFFAWMSPVVKRGRSILQRIWGIMVLGHCRATWIEYYKRGIISREEMLKRIEDCVKERQNNASPECHEPPL